MGFFEDKLAAAGRVFDSVADRALGGSSPGALGRRGGEMASWARDRFERWDDSLAHRGVHVNTMRLAKLGAITLLAGVTTWSVVHTARAFFKDPVVARVTPAEEQQSLALSSQIVQQKQAEAEASARPGARPGPSPRVVRPMRGSGTGP